MKEVNSVRRSVPASITNSPRRSQAYGIIVTKSVQAATQSRPSSLRRSKQSAGKVVVVGVDSLRRSTQANGHHHKSGHRSSAMSTEAAQSIPRSRHSNGSNSHQSSPSHKLPYQTHVRSANLINHYQHDKYLKDLKYASVIKNDHSSERMLSEDGTLNSSSLKSEKLSDSPTNTTMTSVESEGVHHAKAHSKSSKGSKKAPKEEVDPALKRFQFIQMTLIVCNVVALICGVTALIVAGFVDPRPLYKLNTFGGQLSLASVYMIITSLAGLYGARRESCSLLVLYAVLIIGSLFCRSVFYFIATFISSGSTIALSMIAAFLEVILILFAFALAVEVRIKKLVNKKQQQLLSGSDGEQKV